MPPRYRAALALTLALAASLPAAAKPVRHHRAAPRRSVSTLVVSPDELYSRRALRRARIILQLKLMELRMLRLDQVRKALERHMPVDELLREP